MDRRGFLKSTGAAAAAVSVATVQSEATGVKRAEVAGAVRDDFHQPLNLGSSFELLTSGPGEWAVRLGQRLTAIGGDAFGVNVVESRGGSIEAAMLADVDLYIGPVAADITFDDAFAVFAGLPGRTGLDGQEHAAWLDAGGGQALWDELSAGFGVKPLLVGLIDAPARLITARPLDLHAGLSGARIAADGIARRIALELGATPVPLAPTDVVPVLLAGHILAADGNRSCLDAAWTAPGLVHYAGGLGAPAEAIVLGVRLGLWQRLTAVERTMFEMAAAESVQHTLVESRSLSRRSPVAGPRLPPRLAREIALATDAVVGAIGEQSPHARRIVESQRSFARRIEKPLGVSAMQFV